MRSSFFGLNVATQGLFTAQGALNITNHNISNAETKGYSRQYADISATRALPDGKRGMVGTGAEITGIYQARNTYIDSKYWSMSNDLGQYTIKSEMLNQVEMLFNEPSETGYNEIMGDLFATLQTLSTNPAEDAMVTNFVTASDTFAQYFNNMGEQLIDIQRDANFGVKTAITQINFIAEQLTTINSQIGNLELNAGSANDLRDERVKLIDQLSEIVNIDTKETTDVNGKKRFIVTINGQVLVDGPTLNTLKPVPRTTLNNPEDQPDLYDIYWQSGKKLYLNNETSSGTLKGYLDIRDGNNGENFKASIVNNVAGPPQVLTVENMTRHDIPTAGFITVGNTRYEYTDATYNNATEQMTFTLALTAPPLTGTPDIQIGETVDYKGIPYYISQLNSFVRTMARAFNETHKTGGGGNNIELFNFTGYTGTPPQLALDENNLYTYNQINIHNFAFSEDVIEDNSLLYNSSDPGAGESANDLFIDLLDLKHNVTLFTTGKPDSFMQSIISELGIDSKKAISFKIGQENLTNLIENQRKSISSVDLNEETADMIRFQQAYNFSAKIITVMDEIYDVTINQLVRR